MVDSNLNPNPLAIDFIKKSSQNKGGHLCNFGKILLGRTGEK